MPKILVTPLSAVHECIRLHAPSHLVTLLGEAYMIGTPSGIAEERHLRLTMNDVTDSSLDEFAPSEKHVVDLLAFARQWNGDAPMLVHCWAGISRSMAATFTILCDRIGPDREFQIARAMRRRAPHADPNRLFVRFADRVLGRSGRMIKAVDAIGRGTLTVEGHLVEIPLLLEAE
jgi:predicted protein tyrosine phosphatase